MMNKKILKVLAVAVCAVLLVVGSVAGTLAYLTAQTETITNTFTVGNVTITLAEENSLAADTKLMPGKSYTKDPVVSVTAGSEACWLFVKVQNDIFDIEGETTIAGQITNNGWTLLQESNDKKESVYYRSVAADDAQAGDNFNVFGGFTIKGDVTGATMTNYAGAKITVTAYAIQADGFTEVADAWSTLMSTYASTQS